MEAALHFGGADDFFVLSSSHNRKIMEIFHKLVVLLDAQQHAFFVALLINDIFGGGFMCLHFSFLSGVNISNPHSEKSNPAGLPPI